MALKFVRDTVFVSQSRDPYVNIALQTCIADRYAVSLSEKKSLFISATNPTVVIGKYQNCWNVCDFEKMRKNNVVLVRRNTGGNARYIGRGNCLFNFLWKPKSTDRSVDSFLTVRNALSSLQFDTVCDTNNRITIGGKRVVDSLVSKRGGVRMHSGAIYFDTNIAKLPIYLKQLQHDGNAVARIVSSVTKLTDITKDISHKMIDTALISAFAENKCDIMHLDGENMGDDQHLFDLIYKRHTSREHLYNGIHTYTHRLGHRFSFGDVEILLTGEESILACRIYSNCVDIDFIDTLQTVFVGKQFSPKLPYAIWNEMNKPEDQVWMSMLVEFCKWFNELDSMYGISYSRHSEK